MTRLLIIGMACTVQLMAEVMGERLIPFRNLSESRVSYMMTSLTGLLPDSGTEILIG